MFPLSMQLLQEDMLNPIVSGGLTGALLAVRSGPMVCISESSKAVLHISFIFWITIIHLFKIYLVDYIH